DLDPIDESDPLGVGLDALGSELRPRCDRGDPALKRPAGEGVGAYHGRQAEARAPEIRLVDIRPEPDMIEIGKSYHRCAGQHHFAQLCLTREDHTAERSGKHRVAEDDLLELEVLAGASNRRL